jgi:hypothetical protein
MIFGRVSRSTSLLAGIDCGALQEQCREPAVSCTRLFQSIY